MLTLVLSIIGIGILFALAYVSHNVYVSLHNTNLRLEKLEYDLNNLTYSADRLDQMDTDLNNLANTYYMCWKQPLADGCKLDYKHRKLVENEIKTIQASEY
jgi:hypothetical protein